MIDLSFLRERETEREREKEKRREREREREREIDCDTKGLTRVHGGTGPNFADGL